MLNRVGSTNDKAKLSVAMVLFPRLTLLDLIGPATALGFYAQCSCRVQGYDRSPEGMGVSLGEKFPVKCVGVISKVFLSV